jgi:hypothetical protein
MASAIGQVSGIRFQGGAISSEYATPDEVRSAIAAMTDADLLRLEQIAARRLRSMGPLDPAVSPKDLLYESIRRLLEQRRMWKPGRVGFFQLMIGIMWSISSHWAKIRKSSGGPPISSDAAYGRDAALADMLRDPSASQEEELARSQQEASIRHLFANDTMATAVIDDLLAGARFHDIREKHSLDPLAFQATMKRIRRKLPA